MSGCGSVGRVVASDIRDPWFESRQPFNKHLFTVQCVEKAKIKKKEGGKGIFLKKKILIVLLRVGAERSRWTNPAQRTDDLRRRAKQGFGSGQLQPLPVVGLRRPELPARKLRIRQGRVRVRAQLPRWTGLRQKLF